MHIYDTSCLRVAFLNNVSELAQLKLDGLFFYNIYADSMMLIKSNDLSKNVLNMNTHYLELQISACTES